jgi:hypothetical protein
MGMSGRFQTSKRRRFFFEKKKQETSFPFAPGRHNIPARKDQKFFGAFCQKRTTFFPCMTAA